MKKNRVTLTCDKCGQPYEAKAYMATRTEKHYCSKKCWSERNPPKEKTCPTCLKPFVSTDKDAIFCSRSCRGKSFFGEKSPFWKGGKSLTTWRRRHGGALKRWSKAVLERDNYTCQKCGATDKLQAHHITPLKQSVERALDIDNGLTVCVACHSAIHGFPTDRFAARRREAAAVH